MREGSGCDVTASSERLFMWLVVFDLGISYVLPASCIVVANCYIVYAYAMLQRPAHWLYKHRVRFSVSTGHPTQKTLLLHTTEPIEKTITVAYEYEKRMHYIKALTSITTQALRVKLGATGQWRT